MRRTIIFIFATVLIALAACTEKKTTKQPAAVNEPANLAPDSTIYGICGTGTAMSTVELIRAEGDTLTYIIADGDEEVVKGGLFAGDRLALTAYDNADGEHVATSVINLNTLMGHWTSLDKNFTMESGGEVKSEVKAESNPWTSWKVSNGNLVLNTDTFAITTLGPDSLELENATGIFVYKRAK